MSAETAMLPATTQSREVRLGFDTKDGMDALLRAANILANSTLVPTTYRKFITDKQGNVTGENPSGLANCAVALNMAGRMAIDPLMCMQNLHIIEGKPSWSSPFIIASINQSGRFSPLHFDLSAPGEPEEVSYTYQEWVDTPSGKRRPVDKVGTLTVRHQTCRAWAIEKATGERLDGPLVSMQMAIDEGWLQKNGSKWRTMQEVMLRYRSASLFGRIYAPELLMGTPSTEEVHDYVDTEVVETPTGPVYTASASASPEAPESTTQSIRKVLWPIPSQEKFSELMDQAYSAFKVAGFDDRWPTFQDKWNPRKNVGDDKGTLKDLADEIAPFIHYTNGKTKTEAPGGEASKDETAATEKGNK